MLNQVSRGALHSATYLEDYLDCVENLPGDLQVMVSRLWELDIRYQSVFSDLQRRQHALEQSVTECAGQQESRRGRHLTAMQNSLILLQQVADEKLATLQAVHDTIDSKSRQLQLDAKSIEYESGELRSSRVVSQTPGTASASQTGNDSPSSPPALTASDTGGGSSRRRRRRVRGTRAVLDADGDTRGDGTPPPSASTSASAKQKQLRSSSAGVATKRRKRKTQQERDRSPVEVPIEPDEPTYCLCEQVFFGEMIGCDNDLCPIEWFHFSCVNIVHKPKGRWYCPRCRGDRTNVMKPKHVFLKELQKYNKQKEEQRDKKSY